MRAGELRHRVTIQRATEARDEAGQPIKTWVALMTVYAAVEPLAGSERLAAQAIRPSANYRVRMRCYPEYTVRPTDRIVWGTRVFDIVAALDLEERGEEVRMACAEVLT